MLYFASELHIGCCRYYYLCESSVIIGASLATDEYRWNWKLGKIYMQKRKVSNILPVHGVGLAQYVS